MVDIRVGEGRMVAWMTGLFALTQASHGVGANAADTLFFLRFGVEFLPVMILASGPVLMLATLGYTVGLGRLGAGRWLALLPAGLAGLTVLEWLAIFLRWPGIYVVIWLGAQLAILLSYTAMWNVAGEVSTTRQARRLFPLFASAGMAGGIIGNVITGPLAELWGAENLLLVQAGFLACAAVVMSTGVRRFLWRSELPLASGILADLRLGYEVTRSTSLLRLLTWSAGAFSMLFFLVTFPFGAIVADSFTSESEMAGFLGLFSAAATGLTFLASLFLVNRLFARIGVVASLLIVPLIYFAGFGTWLISFTLVSATIVRGVQWVAVNALGGTAWSSLFNAVPGRRRSQVMAFISGVPTQLGTMAAGGVLILSGTLSPDVISGVGLILALMLVVLVLRMRPAYIGALTNAIRQGMVEIFDAPLQSVQPATLDADGVAALVTTLDDPQPAARILAIRTLGRLRPGQVSEQLESALVDVDAAVRLAALETIASPQAAESRLIDPSSRVRRSAIAILERGGQKVVPAAATVLHDMDPTVRATAAVLVGIDQGRPVIDEMLTSSDPLTLVAALSALARQPGVSDRSPEQFGRDPDRRVRAAAARAMASRLDSVSTLRELLEDSSIRVRSAAAASLASSSVETLIEVLATGSVRASEAALVAMTDAGLGEEQLAGWVAGEVDRARFLRRHHLALAQAVPSPALDYLRRLLLMRQFRLEHWALLGFRDSELGEDMPWVRRGIWSKDPDVRAFSLEALDSVRDSPAVRGLIALLEGVDPADIPSATTSLSELARDHDQWIRVLAVACLAEGAQIAGDSDLDHSALVEASVSSWRSNDMEAIPLLSPVDRVLALQRVAMFSELDPEDLEKVALVTTERRYEPNEFIYHEGAPGDEMLVIVRGEVEVRHGGTQMIRSYGAGQHVGELALLRRAPRSADVVARADGVFGLALGASELEGILEERPAVAMAMLATLADRLGTSL